MSRRQTTILVLAILLTLFLRDLPYFNVIVIDKMWIVYLLLFLLILVSFIHMKITTFYYIIVFVFSMVLVMTLLSLRFFAESGGIILYFSLWIAWGVHVWSSRKEQT